MTIGLERRLPSLQDPIETGTACMKHDDIWRALDTLAAEHGLSASGLAKRSGLDATTFNPSKRRMPDGRARWPSTESLAKVLGATGASLEDFTALVSGARTLGNVASGVRAAARRIPLIGLAQAGGDGFFDDGGYPVGGGWDEVSLPDVSDANAYALEISGDSMEPVFRDGDMVIVSPAAPIRRGDRVVARTTRGEVMAKQLVRRSAKRVELRSLNPEHPDYSFDLNEVAWLHRIIWASQ
jgi:phage repressor protein C with HTH and peptisase S24 domain